MKVYGNFSVHMKTKIASQVTKLDISILFLNSLVLKVSNAFFTELFTNYWRFWGFYMRKIKNLPPFYWFRLRVCKIQVQKNFSYCRIFPSCHKLSLLGCFLLFNHIASFSSPSLLLRGNKHFKRQIIFIINSENEMPKSHKFVQDFSFTFITTKLNGRNTMDIEVGFC